MVVAYFMVNGSGMDDNQALVYVRHRYSLGIPNPILRKQVCLRQSPVHRVSAVSALTLCEPVCVTAPSVQPIQQLLQDQSAGSSRVIAVSYRC